MVTVSQILRDCGVEPLPEYANLIYVDGLQNNTPLNKLTNAAKLSKYFNPGVDPATGKPYPTTDPRFVLEATLKPDHNLIDVSQCSVPVPLNEANLKKYTKGTSITIAVPTEPGFIKVVGVDPPMPPTPNNCYYNWMCENIGILLFLLIVIIILILVYCYCVKRNKSNC